MKYGIMLALLGILQIGLATNTGPAALLFVWSGLSWIIAGCAYGFNKAAVFGKRPGGSMTWWNICLLFPYLAATWLLWYVQKTITKEACYHEIAPGIWLGRRCAGHGLPPDVKLVVDMTAEFSEPQEVRADRFYLCVPTLDASVPSLNAFQALIQTIVNFQEPIYVHCALGHGRSATVIVAVLVAKGNAASLDQAEHRVKSARSGVEINAAQRQLLNRWMASTLTDGC